ncbi:hypothetical protein QL285_058187 [Trifolium repens]|nr:hypothetical protein QL285_071551 [Trifolium repens]KAK2396538.1 hypothetical protein QL285_058187 [Trifolium repens]
METTAKSWPMADISSLLAKKNELEEQIVLKVMKLQLKSKALQMSRENSECLIQIQSLREEVGRKIQEKERLIEDRDNLTRQLRDLELEMSTLRSKNSKDEEQIRATIQEISHLQDNIYKAEEEASGKIIAFTAKIDNLQKDLLSLQKTKRELELCCEKLEDTMDLKRTLKELEEHNS